MKLYNEHKFCFIICTNNTLFLEECLLYLSFLEMPEGYQAETLTIMDAVSMAAGYNEGMNASDARYKIYLHQDTIILEKKFLKKLLKIFAQDKTIGMVGMTGAEEMPKDGIIRHGKGCGAFYPVEKFQDAGFTEFETLKKGIRDVQAVEGYLIATREDIPWREDIFTGWEFCGISQALEFQRAGYRVVVPAQDPPWTVHACGHLAGWQDEGSRKALLDNYPEIQEGKKGLRIIFFYNGTIPMRGLPAGLARLGHQVEVAEQIMRISNAPEVEREAAEEILEEGHYDLAVTYDFVANVSEACKAVGVKYLAWVYDSPLMSLYGKEVENDCNYICVFDKIQYSRLKEKKLAHLYHYPLAAETDCFGGVNISRQDEKRYGEDISFVGRLYVKRGYEELMEDAPEPLRREAEEIVYGTDCRWDGKTTMLGKASPELVEYMTGKVGAEAFDSLTIDPRYFFESLRLARKTNEVERIRILNSLAERHQVALYSDEANLEEKGLKGVSVRPWVDYRTEMPKVFHLSKINLNITSRSIESGIPQRVFDVLAVGGFMLTNYQPELEEYFRAGVDLEVYHDLNELLDKADYYLKHEKPRIRIAMNGYLKVKANHGYDRRMKKVLEGIR